MFIVFYAKTRLANLLCSAQNFKVPVIDLAAWLVVSGLNVLLDYSSLYRAVSQIAGKRKGM